MRVPRREPVYEAVQRQLERRVDPDRAAEYGVRRTVRAILAASATNAVVFLPIAFTSFDDPFLRSTLQVLVVAILLPMVGSVIVAVGLVPLLARRLAAPAAMARLEMLRSRREQQGGMRAPDRVRELFGALMTVALRRPPNQRPVRRGSSRINGARTYSISPTRSSIAIPTPFTTVRPERNTWPRRSNCIAAFQSSPTSGSFSSSSGSTRCCRTRIRSRSG